MTDDRDLIAFEDAQIWGGDEALIDLAIVDDCIIGTIPIDRLSIFDPFKSPPWFDGRDTTKEMVLKAIESQRLNADPYPGYNWSTEGAWTSEMHAERVAFLYVNKASEPISIEFIDPYSASMEITDGWHRIAAAILRGDKEVQIEVGGYFRHAVARLGAICREYQVVSTQGVDIGSSLGSRGM